MRGYIRYSSSAQQQFLPLIATLAGVLGAIPLEPTDPRAANLTLRFDALAEFVNATAHDATAAVFDRFANMTTGLLNPGYDVHGHPHALPPLTRTPNLKLVDYVPRDACSRSGSTMAASRSRPSTPTDRCRRAVAKADRRLRI